MYIVQVAYGFCQNGTNNYVNNINKVDKIRSTKKNNLFLYGLY